jgi:hypothetical protein
MKLLLAASLIAFSTAAAAQLLPPRDPGQWRDAQNASGGGTAVTPPARDADASRALFDRLDRNKDGHLSAQELATDDANSGNWITIDRNGDGRIGRNEFTIIDRGVSAGASAPKQ